MRPRSQGSAPENFLKLDMVGWASSSGRDVAVQGGGAIPQSDGVGIIFFQR